ncbi:elongation of very long chain fatty acids protein 7 [Patella vulgata]|uniref:elongation of very long chain fatty acids protein 7 n=1 Tax=Patella vulgata TaxID=6465 RepID=UPI0021803373|nr:elongation of very long chain fatty acids protein 7 [Patella vulgata]
MANIFTNAVKMYDELMTKADSRVDGWVLMSSPWPSILICVAYFIFVRLGPTFMANRKPMDLKNLLLVYNFSMVILSGYIFVEFLLSGWGTGYSYGCQPVDYSNTPKAMRMVRVCWLFYFSKFIELLDTVFFLLRKKFNQVSFLHVFHHGVMPFSWWFGVKFAAGGFGTFHALLNSFIHFLMYTYYGVAALGPEFQKYLWWKKYMTKLQITQFICVALHASQLLFIDCNYSMIFVYWIGAYAVIFLVLFADFYIKAYKKPQHLKDHNANGVVKNGVKSKSS